MAEPTDRVSSEAPWRGPAAPCVYCGQVIPRDSPRCSHCRTAFSPAVRQAYREAVGPWFYLVQKNPSGRGVTFETLVKLVEKGRIKADSVIRGPTTHQDWMYAAETPRLSKYLGICPHCFGGATPDQTYCTHCQLSMNERPGSPRPGVPPELVKAPFHKAGHDLEVELAKRAAAAEEARTETISDAEAPTPVAAGAPVAAGPAAAPAGAAGPAAEARAAVSALVRGSGAPPSRLRRAPKLWIVLALTWGTLLVVFTIFLAAPAPGWGPLASLHASWRGMLGLGGAASGEPPGPHDAALAAWVSDRLREADGSIAAGDYEKAIAIYQAIINRTGDSRWHARIADLRDRIRQDTEQRLADLRAKLTDAESLAEKHEYDAALTVLRNIGAKDRALLEGIGVDVVKMEDTVRTARDQYQTALRQQKQRLAAELARAGQLRAQKKPQEALDVYSLILRAFPRDLITQQVDIDKVIGDVKAEIQAGIAPPPPLPPLPPPPPLFTEEETIRKVADLMEQAVKLEQEEKFSEALLKLNEVKTFDRKYWPDTLEKRIETVKKKKEALEFFGMERRP